MGKTFAELIFVGRLLLDSLLDIFVGKYFCKIHIGTHNGNTFAGLILEICKGNVLGKYARTNGHICKINIGNLLRKYFYIRNLLVNC